MKLATKTALVTGAGQGIGQGCALALAAAGADLIVNDKPGSAELASTVAQVEAMGRRCVAIPSDVFTRSGCESLVEQASQSGPIDILISNPAYGRRCAFLDYEPEEFERVIAATLVSAFHLGQLAARNFVARGGGGKMVFISSVQAELPVANSVAYSAAKAGLNHLVRTMAVELSRHRINVNAIEPGWIDTPGERRTFDEAMIREHGPRLPWGRLGLPADIGKAAAFLASDDADYITGEILAVDGGFRYKDCRADDLIPTQNP